MLLLLPIEYDMLLIWRIGSSVYVLWLKYNKENQEATQQNQRCNKVRRENFYVQHIRRETNWENWDLQGALNARKYNKPSHTQMHEPTQHTQRMYVQSKREQEQQRKLLRSKKKSYLVDTQKLLETWRKKISICFIYYITCHSPNWLWTTMR